MPIQSDVDATALLQQLQRQLFSFCWEIAYKACFCKPVPRSKDYSPTNSTALPIQLTYIVPGARAAVEDDLKDKIQRIVEATIDRGQRDFLGLSSPIWSLAMSLNATIAGYEWLLRWSLPYNHRRVAAFVQIFDQRLRAIDPDHAPPPPTESEMDAGQANRYLHAMRDCVKRLLPPWNPLDSLPRIAGGLRSWAARPMPSLETQLGWICHISPIRAFLQEREPLLLAIATAFRKTGRDGLAIEFEQHVRGSLIEAFRILSRAGDLCWGDDANLINRVGNNPNVLAARKAERDGFTDQYRQAVAAVLRAAEWLDQVDVAAPLTPAKSETVKMNQGFPAEPNAETDRDELREFTRLFIEEELNISADTRRRIVEEAGLPKAGIGERPKYSLAEVQQLCQYIIDIPERRRLLERACPLSEKLAVKKAAQNAAKNAAKKPHAL